MKAENRREEILKLLRNSDEPISASSIAGQYGVSRQIVVGDIALLRASGESIVATPRGYRLEIEEEPHRIIRTIACQHDVSFMEKELQICIDFGCKVLDVIIEHPIYGQIVGQLQLNNRYDISQFIEKIQHQNAHALSELTEGVHLHTIECPSQGACDRVIAALAAENILLSDNTAE